MGWEDALEEGVAATLAITGESHWTEKTLVGPSPGVKTVDMAEVTFTFTFTGMLLPVHASLGGGVDQENSNWEGLHSSVLL